ncbi:MAG: penicillin-binding protein 1A, partial [Candidatus Binatia bacterium]
LDRRRGYRGPLRRLTEAEAEPFLDEQEKSLPASGLAKGKSAEALVVKATKERAVVRIGSRTGILPASGMEWAGKPERFQPGDVILVRVEKAPDDGSLEVALDQAPDVEGAMLALEAQTGYVRAMVGGYDFRRSQFNRAVQAMRQPGSAFKPLVYAAALDRGYTPASVVIDAPIVFDDYSKQLWKPENYDEKFHGATRLRDALTFSRNVISVKLAQTIGVDYILSYLPRFGLVRPFQRNLSLALGSSEVTLLELVRAFDVFATGGRLCTPVFVLKITDRAGNVLEERLPTCEETMSPETAYLMTSMMKEVVQRGTGQRARALGRPVAGKTGTTNELMDAWFLGYTPGLVAGAWVGFDEKKTLGKKETGGRAALPLWLRFMQAAVENSPVTDFSIPPGIVFVNIDAKTGLRASPEGGTILLESFRRGTEPQRFTQSARGPDPGDFFRGDF